MNQKYQFLTIGLVVIALAGGYLAGTTVGKNKQIVPAPTANADLQSFVSKKMNLSFLYPQGSLGPIQDANPIQIPSDSSELTMYLISSQETKYGSIKDWLAAQPKGDSSHGGLKPLIWIDTDRLIAEEYEIVDYNSNKPIYGKHLDAFVLSGSHLVEVKIRGQAKPLDPDTTDSTILTIVSTLKVEP